MIGDMGETAEDIDTEERPAVEDVETAKALLDYYQMRRGIEYGSKKRREHEEDMVEAIQLMRELNVDPLRYINWALSMYEPPYMNMVLSNNNIRRYSRSSNRSSKGMFRADKNAIRSRLNYGMEPNNIYHETKLSGSPLILFMFIKSGGVDEEEVDNICDLERKALIQWNVLSEEVQEDLLEFFNLEEFNFHM